VKTYASSAEECYGKAATLIKPRDIQEAKKRYHFRIREFCQSK
jgi:hypothetical protein